MWLKHGISYILKGLKHGTIYKLDVVMEINTDIRGKVKLSLGLTRHHAMRAYHVLNQAPRQEGVWVSESIAPRILNLGASWR
jgi:hypothetical protein